MDDYTAPQGRTQSELTDLQQLATKRLVELDLRAAFEREWTAEEQTECDAVLGAGLGPTTRKCNRDFVIKIDNQLKSGLGYGLALFGPTRKLARLQMGDERIFFEVSPIEGAAAERRSVLRSLGGSTAFECPRMVVDGAQVSPTLHLALDEGCIDFPEAIWMAVWKQYRCALQFDILHRLRNDMLGAVSDAGLSVLRLEFHQARPVR